MYTREEWVNKLRNQELDSEQKRKLPVIIAFINGLDVWIWKNDYPLPFGPPRKKQTFIFRSSGMLSTFGRELRYKAFQPGYTPTVEDFKEGYVV